MKKRGATTADLFDRNKTAEQLVEEFELTPEIRAWAAREAPSVPVEREIEAWKDRCRALRYKHSKGIPIGDAAASFRTACRNAEEWEIYRKRGSRPSAKSAEFKRE